MLIPRRKGLEAPGSIIKGGEVQFAVTGTEQRELYVHRKCDGTFERGAGRRAWVPPPAYMESTQ